MIAKTIKTAARPICQPVALPAAICTGSAMLDVGGATVRTPLIAMFGVTEEATHIGEQFFRCIAVFYVINGWAMAFRGYLEGIGDVMFSGMAGIASLGVRIVLPYALVGIFDNMVIAYAEAFSWCFMLMLFVVRFAWKW